VASTTLQPISDISGSEVGPGTGWQIEGGGSTAWQSLTDGSDTTFIVAPSSGGYAKETLSTPSDSLFLLATAVTINLRCETSSSKKTGGVSAQIYQSDGATALTAAGSTGTVTTSYATYSFSVTLSGSQTLAAWTGAQLWISTTNNDDAVSEASVTVTYTQGGNDVVGVGGGGSGSFVMGGAAGSRRVQGYRFVYNRIRTLIFAHKKSMVRLRVA